jgi:CRISPR/Cas system-associated exonuclease Cas4 (RecB family)
MIKTWMNCPLQAKFQEIEKLPRRQHSKASFGTCVHEALEIYNVLGDLDKSVLRFKETWSNPEIIGVKPDVWGKDQYGSLMTRGVEILEQYDQKTKWETREVISVEHRFCVPFGDHEISGYVDLVELKNNSKGNPVLRIVDYKTNARQPTLQDLRFDVQMTVYVYASLQKEFWVGYNDEYPGLEDGEELFNRFVDIPRMPVWYHLWGNKELLAGERDDHDFMRLYRVCTEIDKAVKTDVYVPSISFESCKFCDYQDRCEVVVPIKHKLDKKIEEDEIF